MRKWFAVLLFGALSLSGMSFSAALAQTVEQGLWLLEQGDELRIRAGSVDDQKQALAKYEEALGVFEVVNEIRGRGVVLNNIGSVVQRWGQYQKAFEYYEKALEIGREVGDGRGEGIALSNIAGVYDHWGQYEKALQYFETSLEITRKMADLKGEGVVLNNIGSVYSSQGRYQKALEYYDKSLKIRKEEGDIQGEGMTLNNIGRVYGHWGQYGKALEYYNSAMAIVRKAGDIEGVGIILNNAGPVYGKGGEHQKAFVYFEKALEIRRNLGDLNGEGMTLNNIAPVCYEWGQYQKALEYYEKSLEIARNVNDVSGEGVVLGNIGYIYLNWCQYKTAVEYFEKTLEIEKRIGVPHDGTEHPIGTAYLSTGDLAKAEPLLTKAGGWLSLGLLALAKGDYWEATNQYQKILTKSKENRNIEGLFAGHTGLGLAYEGLKEYDRAAEHFTEAVRLTEEIRDSLTPGQRANFFDVQIWHIPRITPYEGLARVLLKGGKLYRSLKQSEGTKARAFVEVISNRAGQAASDVPAELLEMDAEINNKLAAMTQGLHKAYEKGHAEAIESFEKQVKALREERDRHVSSLRKDYPLFAATKYPQPMDLSESALADNEWLVEYEVTEPGICIYLVRGKKIVKALFKPCPRADLEKLAGRFRTPLEISPDRDDFDGKLASFDFAASKELSDLLLSDVLSDIPKGAPLIVVPDDCLGVVPFEMLVVKGGGVVKTDRAIPYVEGAEFLADRNPISYNQSVTALTLARIHARPMPKARNLMVVADPVFDEKDERLANAPKQEGPTGILADFFRRLMTADTSGLTGPGRLPRLALTGRLARDLKAIYKEDAVVQTGMDATKSKFLEKTAPQLDRYGGLVFATHGYFGRDLPGIMEPVLILTLVPPGTDGYLRVTEVMGLKMNADIVALTACQTGVGRRTAGEGTMGMGRAFQYAGARSVLMSLWSVSEEASVSLVKSFFRHLKEGKTKAEALAKARTKLRAEGFNHPFFWAGFILVGEAN